MKHILFLLLVFVSIWGNARAQNYARYADIQSTWRDPELERQAIWVVNRKVSGIRCQEHYISAKIVSEGWHEQHNRHGDLASRTVHMELYAETDNDRCGVAHCIFRQKMLDGGVWSPRLYLVELGELYHMECE